LSYSRFSILVKSIFLGFSLILASKISVITESEFNCDKYLHETKLSVKITVRC